MSRFQCHVCEQWYENWSMDFHTIKIDDIKVMQALAKVNPMIVVEHSNEEVVICEECFNKLFFYCTTCYHHVLKGELCKCSHGRILEHYDKSIVFPKYNGKVKYQNLRLGLEVESLFRGSYEKKLKALEEFTKILGPNLCKFKYDGSLCDCHDVHKGAEFVTMPLYFEHFKVLSKKWERAFNKFRDMGGHSFDSDKTGCHIHISRDAFISYKHLYNFYIGITKNPRFTARIAKRSQNEYCETPANKAGKRFKGLYRYAYESISRNAGSRYQMVNLKNKNTVEVRVYKGSIKWSSVMGYMQHVYSMFEYSLLITQQKKDFTVEEYRRFVIANKGKYPELAKVI